MQLYFSPGACSLSPHIVAREAGLDVTLVPVALRDKKLPDGGDYRTVNPKGQVPALRTDDGIVLTEGAVIVQFLADQKPESGLVPPAGSMARYQTQEWLNFIAAEVHKSYSPLFNPKAAPEIKDAQRAHLATKLDLVAQHLATRPFVMGEQFSAPDAYLFTVLRWSPVVGVDLSRWPVLEQYVARVGARPAVQAALEAEARAK